MAIEAKRGCGYRKVGGTYLIGGKLAAPCCKLPILLHICPTCSQGIKQTRGWTWIDPKPWLEGACIDPVMARQNCPCANPENLGNRVGLLWIGEKFYPTPAHFAAEAAAMGISRRITAVPRAFKLGTDWCFLAHPKVARVEDTWSGGIFAIFKPTAIEKIVTQTQSQDADAMAKLEKADITPVVVPDDDPDHLGTVYDDDTNEIASMFDAPQ